MKSVRTEWVGFRDARSYGEGIIDIEFDVQYSIVDLKLTQEPIQLAIYRRSI